MARCLIAKRFGKMCLSEAIRYYSSTARNIYKFDYTMLAMSFILEFFLKKVNRNFYYDQDDYQNF